MTEKNKKDYSLGKIYKIQPICEHDENEIYIGSTCQPLLSQRMAKHRANYKDWKNGKYHFVTSYNIFEKYGVENCEIVLIESVNAKSKDELYAKEAHYIKSMCCINKFIPLRTPKEYRDDKKENIIIVIS